MAVSIPQGLTKTQPCATVMRFEREVAQTSPVRQAWSPARLLASWRWRFMVRQELSRLSPRDLDDIGLCYHEVADEIRKPFWRD